MFRGKVSSLKSPADLADRFTASRECGSDVGSDRLLTEACPGTVRYIKLSTLMISRLLIWFCPLESLKQFAVLLRENHFVGFNMTTQIGDVGETKPSIAQDLTTNNASSPAYMGTPGQTHTQPPQVNSNGPQAGSSVDVKPSKSSLAQAQASVSSPSSGPTSATTPAASTPGASTSTPQVANATLKRKVQSDTASPTTSHDGPANKRARPKGGQRGG